MDEKYVWPLIGVLLGWVLNRVGTYSGDAYEKRSKYGRAIAALFLLHDETRLLVRWLDDMKPQVDSWEEYEIFRKYTLDTHFLKSQSVLEMMDKAFYEVSGIDPFLSLKLIGLKKGIMFQKNASLEGIPTLDQELYLKTICELEVVLIASKIGLERIIKQIAIKCGPLAYLKVKRNLKKGENAISDLGCISRTNIRELKKSF